MLVSKVRFNGRSAAVTSRVRGVERALFLTRPDVWVKLDTLTSTLCGRATAGRGGPTVMSRLDVTWKDPPTDAELSLISGLWTQAQHRAGNRWFDPDDADGIVHLLLVGPPRQVDFVDRPAAAAAE